MNRKNGWTLIASLTFVASPFNAHAQVTVDQLAKPPKDARQFSIVSASAKHGSDSIWTTPDGTTMIRESIVLRGQIFELDEAIKRGSDGMQVDDTVRGFTPNGDAAETFTRRGESAQWKSQVDAGSAPYKSPAYYITQSATFMDNGLLLEALLAAPDKSLALLPGGRAHAEKLTEATVTNGKTTQVVTAWAITGLFNSPLPVWATAQNKFFGLSIGLAILPAGYEGNLQSLNKAQDEALAARSPILLKQLLNTPAGPVAFTHVKAFLGGTTFADDQTIIVDKGLITAAGPAATTTVPAGAQIIDGTGKTLVPGLWDSHQHFGDDSTGPFLLSLGITSVRDPGNDNALTIARAKRRAKGDLLSPKVYPSVLIDGKGPYSAQLGTIVTSQAEAIAAVDKAKADGFTGIKFYGTYNPAWVAPATAEAHKLGLHVHGHLPAGMRPSQAIADGYDEITHIYFVSMEAMPDSVVNTSNGINRFEGTGRYLKDVDLNAPPMSTLIQTMAAKHIVSDPTLVVVEALFVPINGDLSPAYAPYIGTLPPAMERGFRQGGFTVPKDLTRDDFRKSFSKEVQLVGLMHKAGVPIVAGTDGSGMELVRELELYEQAGFTPEEALAAATIVPAKNVGADKTTGSIEVGKIADLDLVEGDPSKHIGDLRNTRTIMMGGKLMDADALRTASGFSGRPTTNQ
jgi:imidazolonepropionase-like amidohydrolase